jgi:hypothetical protein
MGEGGGAIIEVDQIWGGMAGTGRFCAELRWCPAFVIPFLNGGQSSNPPQLIAGSQSLLSASKTDQVLILSPVFWVSYLKQTLYDGEKGE